MAESLWVLLPAAQRASGEWIDDTLKTRAQEKGLTARFSLAGQFPRNRVEVVRDHDPWARVNELFYRRRGSERLPQMPPALCQRRGDAAARETPAGRVVCRVCPQLCS